jgi:hypothetical protein
MIGLPKKTVDEVNPFSRNIPVQPISERAEK